MSRESFDATAVPAIEAPQNVSGNAQPAAKPAKGRKRRHATDAARVAAFRAARTRFDFVTSNRVGETINSLATQFDCSSNQVLNSLVRYALTNRNFKQVGLWGMNDSTEEKS